MVQYFLYQLLLKILMKSQMDAFDKGKKISVEVPVHKIRFLGGNMSRG